MRVACTLRVAFAAALLLHGYATVPVYFPDDAQVRPTHPNQLNRHNHLINLIITLITRITLQVAQDYISNAQESLATHKDYEAPYRFAAL